MQGQLDLVAPQYELRLPPADGTITAVKLLTSLNLCPSSGEARRLIQGGGAKLGEKKTTIESHDQQIAVTDGLLVWAGKKKYCRVKLG